MEHGGVVAGDAAGGEGTIAVDQRLQGTGLAGAGDEPQSLAGCRDQRQRQGQAPEALVRAGYDDIGIRFECRIIREE